MTKIIHVPLIIIFFMLCGGGLVTQPVHGSDIFVATWGEGSSEIFVVDSTNGNATSLGFAGTDISGLTFSHSTLFGWGQNGSLYRIDQLNGSATLVGVSGFPGVEGAIAAHPSDGFLYAADSTDGVDNLLMIDPSTGAGSIVGGFGNFGADMSGLTFIGTSLYGIDASLNNLVTVNTTTGQADAVGSLGVIVGEGSGSTGGLAYDGNGLYLFDRNGIYSVNSDNGSATSIAAFSDNLAGRNIGGAAAPVVPEPISSMLFIVGGATLGFRRFRRKSSGSK